MKYQRIKGTFDILPPESDKWVHLESIVRRVMQRFNYKEIRPPIFEMTELFARGIGEGTDIVSKEMFSFTDMGGRNLTLRPEATASVVRAFTEESLGKKAPIHKLFYIGPMFRQEKPQKGRQRQFHQFGAEAIGANDPRVDAEIIAISVMILQECGITDFIVALNSVATPEIRAKHREKLLEFVEPMRADFPRVDQEKIDRNPLRLFDSKEARTAELMAKAPLLSEFYDYAVKRDFELVQQTLTEMQIKFEIDPRLVRGLDYYTRTAYEVRSELLGAQDALCGGGRYDLLVEELGGEPTPAVGFAAGMERIMLAVEQAGFPDYAESQLDAFIVAVSEKERAEAVRLAQELRSKGLAVDLDYLDRSMKAQMKEASRQNARFAVLLFGDELKEGKVTVKDLGSGEQEIVVESIVAEALCRLPQSNVLTRTPLSAETLIESEESLWKGYRDMRPRFVRDGAIEPQSYCNAPIRLLYVLKEPNDTVDEGDWDLREFVRTRVRRQTWGLIAKWTKALLDSASGTNWLDVKEVDYGENQLEWLKQIAAINLKKTPGGGSADVRKLKHFAGDHRSFLRDQINILSPQVTILCGPDVRRIFDDTICDRPLDYDRTKNGTEYSRAEEFGLVLAYYHPQAHYPHNLLFNGLVDAVLEVLGKHSPSHS